MTSVRVDGDPVAPPSQAVPSGSDLLSAELDSLARDPVFEAAVRAAVPT